MVSVVHDLSFNSDVLVWQEITAVHSTKWTRSYKLLAIDKQTCNLQLLSRQTNFRITTVKPYPQ